MNRQFENFDLEFSRAAEGYTARVLSSPGGEGAQSFAVPITSLELENVVLQVLAARRVRSITSKQGSRLRSVGGALFKAVFVGEVLQCYLRSLGSCTEASGLRIRLRFVDAPELVNLPWELLYDEAIDQWIALKLDTPLVRYLRLPAQIPPLKVTGPLHVLTVVSDPTDVPHLDIESEAEAVEVALKLLKEADPDSVVSQTLRHPTPEVLQRKLMELPWHVLHFIGHGEFDERTGTGLLVLEDENGKARPITAERLSVMLQGRALKLVILNSCEGSRGGEDHRSGLAQSLIAQGVPAVIAMQFPITDTAALAFSRMFYHALVLGTPLENAVVEARRAIYQDSELEWATPTLYLRSEDGLLFDRTAPSAVRKAVDEDPERTGEDSTPVRREKAPLRSVAVDPVPPVPPVPPQPWWKQRVALAAAAVVAAALAWWRLAPAPSPSPIATALADATRMPLYSSAAPAADASSAPSADASTAPAADATAAPPETSPTLARPYILPSGYRSLFGGSALAGLGLLNKFARCPMAGATVQDTFLIDTHLWALPTNTTIRSGYLVVVPPKGYSQEVWHQGSIGAGTICTTVYFTQANSSLANSDTAAAGLAFWKTDERFWAFLIEPSGRFFVSRYEYAGRKWTTVVRSTFSAQIRRSSLLGNPNNVLAVRVAGGTATLYVNGSNVGTVGGGPAAGKTASGLIAETPASQPHGMPWSFGYYGVGP